MSVTTLFADEGSWVASTRLVYTAEERGALETAAVCAARLERLVAEREALLEAARERARDEGYEAGRRAGTADVARELGDALGVLRDGFEDERRAHRESLVELSLGIVRRLVGEIACDARLAALARVAAAELADEPRLVLHVHPSRVAALGPLLAPTADESLAVPRDGRRRTPFDAVVADEELAADGAEIETSGGRIGIDLETQLDAVREQLLGRAEVLALLDTQPSGEPARDVGGPDDARPLERCAS